MLGEEEGRGTLESGGHFVNEEASPKFPKHFQEHIINSFRGIFRVRDQPFPYPGSWNVSVLPAAAWTGARMTMY